MKTIILLSLFISLNVFSADIQVKGKNAQKIWKSIKIINTIDDLSIIKNNAQRSYFLIDNVQCVFERYNACSFFSLINNKRKMIVAMEGTSLLMQAMADVGIWIDENHSSIATKSIECLKINSVKEYSCHLVKY